MSPLILALAAVAVAIVALGLATAGLVIHVRRGRATTAVRTVLADCNRPHVYADGTTTREGRFLDTDLVPPKPARGHAAIVVTRQEALRAR